MSDLVVLPHCAGVYLMRDKTGRILYVGKAIDLRKRVASYFRPVDAKIRSLMSEVQHIDYISAESEREALIVEQRLIKQHQPVFNTMWKDSKSYPYVKITVNEDFPRIFLTRQRDKDKARYFGPYPNASSVKKLLRWIWRKKFFALRPCAYDFSDSAPLSPQKSNSCLYLHTGECPAPCVNRISKQKYKEIVQKAVLFFEGKNDQLLKIWCKEMKAAAAEMDFERAAQLRDNIQALAHIQERVTFRAMRPEDVQGRIQMSQGLRELQKALNLSKPPLRIEAFDISHIQGTETVASLVVFFHGKPLKSHYRKFRVRTVQGVDDFASMKEVVERRYKRLKTEGAVMPDLVLIDGGSGQLSAALKALDEVGLRKLPVVSLAKQNEEIFLPNTRVPVRLPKDSPALQILQHVRDESHRFAVAFHRQRREKTIGKS